MNILMAASDNMYDGLELVVYSTMAHNKNVHFYIMTMEIHLELEYGYSDFFRISDEHIRDLNKIIKYFDPNSDLTMVYAEECYAKYLEGNPNEKSGFTPFTDLRLLADLLLPELNDCLYLDCDVSVQDNLQDMYYYYLSKCDDYAAYSIPEACDYEGEMVAGVLLMNLAHMRKSGFLKNARKNIWHNHYRFPDQMAIRDAGSPYPMAETYNYMFELTERNYMPAIIHYTNKLNPKVYESGKKVIFYRKYPFLQYVQDGVKLLKNLPLYY